jgi:hypothetical protein
MTVAADIGARSHDATALARGTRYRQRQNSARVARFTANPTNDSMRRMRGNAGKDKVTWEPFHRECCGFCVPFRRTSP